VDRITRKDLKTDKFALEVEHSVEYVAAHKKQAVQYGVIALAVVVIAGGIWYYRGHQHEQRQQALAQAVDVMQATVNPTGGSPGLTFPTEAAKQAASEKAFKDVYEKYPGSAEGTIAATYLGAIEVDMNKLAEAEKYFQLAADSSDKNYASIGKLSLAQLYTGGSRQAEAEKLLRSLIDNPTVFVSKEQATIALAHALTASKPAEARKLLDPLKTERPAVGQVAITLLGQLPPAQ
jgi:predicted negative regulator of RcsB-dependent stress response